MFSNREQKIRNFFACNKIKLANYTCKKSFTKRYLEFYYLKSRRYQLANIRLYKPRKAFGEIMPVRLATTIVIPVSEFRDDSSYKTTEKENLIN